MTQPIRTRLRHLPWDGIRTFLCFASIGMWVAFELTGPFDTPLDVVVRILTIAITLGGVYLLHRALRILFRD
jgi:hypothetical protein